jgi:biopolymer transport protein ExbD
MRRRSLIPPSSIVPINVTPMIDVIMCLIIFYLIVGKLAADQRVNIRLPTTIGGQAPVDERTLIINIVPADDRNPSLDANGVSIVAEGQPIASEGLVSLIRSRRLADQDLWVQVRADRTLTFGQMAPVVRACREAGTATLKLSVERQP